MPAKIYFYEKTSINCVKEHYEATRMNGEDLYVPIETNLQNISFSINPNLYYFLVVYIYMFSFKITC